MRFLSNNPTSHPPIEKKRAKKTWVQIGKKCWALSVSEMFRKNQHTDGFRNPSLSQTLEIMGRFPLPFLAIGEFTGVQQEQQP